MLKRNYNKELENNNPDILNCLANLSNDEVFTPPTTVNKLLDVLPKEIWINENTKFLDPTCKTGVFLREIVKRLNEAEGVTFLLAEQNTTMALRYANYGYILENGRVVMDGEAADLAENEDVKEFYLGVSGGGRRSFRNVKAYRRRKRWLS